METYGIIKQFLTTEKSRTLELDGVYTVVVDSRATKVDVARAFASLYSVRVRQVNISKTRLKFRGGHRGATVKRKEITKALVSLAGTDRVADILKISAPK